MNLFTKKKKGFTIVELVIVVAVIAVLAAILIPTFVGLVEKTRVTADNSLVRDLNNSLAIDSGIKGGEKHKTMQDALNTTDEYGFNVSRINAKAQKSEILWDSVNDVFCYFDGEEIKYIPETKLQTPADDVEDYQYFVIKKGVASSADLSDKYSTYLYQSTATELVTNKGLDVGNETNVTSITYNGGTNAQNVVIRTNSANTTLKIDDASEGTIYHYGEAGALNIIQCHTGSYHENGSIAYAEIAKGRIVLESGAKVEEIHINKKTDSSFDTVIIANNGGANELPERITRDAVEVSTQTLVVKVESNGSSENVYVYANGITGTTEKITEGDNKQNEAVESALGQLVLDNGSNPGEKAQTTEQKQAAKTDIIETAVEKEAVEADESDFWIVCHADAFASGDGTEQDPYIIKTARQLSLLAYNVNTSVAGNYATAYYRLDKNIDLSGKAWTPIGITSGTNIIYFQGHIDGNGHSISGLTNNGKTEVELGMYRDELSSVPGLAAKGYGLFGFAKDAEFIDIDIKSAKIEGSSHFNESGFIVGKAVGTISMTDCSVDENSVFNGKSKVGGMIGFIANGSTAVTVTFSNCSFAGSITVQDRAGAMIGAMTVNAKDIYVFDECTSTGSLTATNTDGYGLGLIGYKYQGDADQQRMCYSTFSFTDCSVDLTKFSASAGVGKYIGKANKSFIMIVDSEYDTNALGQFQDNGQDGVFVFNGQMYVERTGSAGTNMLELTSLSGETYDLGQYRYYGYSSNYTTCTSYGTNLLSKSDSFFASINQSSYVVENYRIKFATGDAKFSLDLEQFSEYVASGYTATVTHTDGPMNGFTIVADSE